ncbi:DUF4397 domain-containing protein [Pedobacter sp. MC2016-15]|uniref:DUF4397 domain-containing protein n=1 Tax=Pedobacter sp. MC2016-15 TaxID=2994473 RepID=UPI0022485D68|nr:DUF4397 domain-containing protein [Pedobacter sp. MC2016-15]MCX2480995.1 DUF4397 domain-containing protein [Pedobacter sp. MC2016-15]
MKFSKKNLSLLQLSAVALLVGTVIIGSSFRNDTDLLSLKQAKVKVINGIFNNPAYVIKVNGKVLSSTPLAYRKSTAYTAIPSGSQTLTVTEQGSKNVILSSKLNVTAGNSASFYLVPETSTSKATGLLIPDDLATIAPKKAKIRFVNLSPDAGSLDLLINGKAVASTVGTEFKEFSEFVEIEPVAGATFALRETGTKNIVATNKNVSVAEGQFTTLWGVGTKGKVAAQSAASQLALGVIVNKPAQ